jgi:acetyl esterase/lipase
MVQRRIKNLLIGTTVLLGVLKTTQAQQVIPLYADSVPNSIEKLAEDIEPTITAFLPPKEIATGTAVIIFPGGGYGFLAFEAEGTKIAQSFMQKGIAAFVVKYRLPNVTNMRDKSMGPLMDAQQAIKMVRKHASQWNIDSNKVGVVGYSAGGHLASTLGTHYGNSYIPNKENINLRPDFMILVYPVISMEASLTHAGSRINLLGTAPSMHSIVFFSNEKQVTSDTPPTYLTQTGDDQVVSVDNSIVFYKALQRNLVDAELHLYPRGGHGFTQRLPENEWLDPMLTFIKREGFLKDSPLK